MSPQKVFKNKVGFTWNPQTSWNALQRVHFKIKPLFYLWCLFLKKYPRVIVEMRKNVNDVIVLWDWPKKMTSTFLWTGYEFLSQIFIMSLRQTFLQLFTINLRKREITPTSDFYSKNLFSSSGKVEKGNYECLKCIIESQ